MSRRQVSHGSRKFRPEKPLIYVFCEGESEQAYAKFLKEHFADVAVLKIPSKIGLFSKAKSDFEKAPKYRNYAEVTDEIWFFFDVEADDWESGMSDGKSSRCCEVFEKSQMCMFGY